MPVLDKKKQPLVKEKVLHRIPEELDFIFVLAQTTHSNLNKSLSGPIFSFVRIRELASSEGKHSWLAGSFQMCFLWQEEFSKICI